MSRTTTATAVRPMAVKRSLNLSAATSLLDPPKYIKAPEKTKVERAPRVKLNKKLIPLTIYKVIFPWTNNTLGIRELVYSTVRNLA